MNNHLIVLTNNFNERLQDETTSLLAFNLRDHSIQGTKIEIGSLKYKAFGLIKYDENQMIKYGSDSSGNLVCITVESFQRNILLKLYIFKNKVFEAKC